MFTKKDKVSGDCLGTGRRKTSVARVCIKAGSGKITVNDRAFEEYFVTDMERRLVTQTLDHVGHTDKVDVFVTGWLAVYSYITVIYIHICSTYI